MNHETNRTRPSFWYLLLVLSLFVYAASGFPGLAESEFLQIEAELKSNDTKSSGDKEPGSNTCPAYEPGQRLCHHPVLPAFRVTENLLFKRDAYLPHAIHGPPVSYSSLC